MVTKRDRYYLIDRLKEYSFLLIVLGLALLAALPQILNHSIILGVDGLFHFNRFYDVAEQIRHFNFHYFISPYASLSVGRMVNSIYGPVGALINGILLLITGSYLRYQVLSRIVIGLIAAWCMYYALRQINVDTHTSRVFAIVYPFTYQVIMWNLNQAFTGWGAALMPLGIMLGIRMVENNHQPISIVQMAVIMAIIVQTHLVSALQVVLILIVYAIFAWVCSPQRTTLIITLLKAVGLFLCLSANIVAGFIELYVGNHPLGIAKVSNPAIRTLNFTSLQPSQYSALLILVISLVMVMVSWRRLTMAMRITGVLGVVFFGLSMPILPWNMIFNQFPLVATIQFPERFIAMGTALLLVVDAQIITAHFFSTRWSIILKSGLVLLGMLMVMINGYSTYRYSQKIFTFPRTVYPVRKHSKGEIRHVRQAFSKQGLKQPLTLATKSTPDYLPLRQVQEGYSMAGYNEFDEVNYHRTQEYPVIKRVVNRRNITLSWVGKRTEKMTLPVAYYVHTQGTFNGKKYQYQGQHGQYLKLPVVNSRIGTNQFVFSYHPWLFSTLLVGLALLSWVFILIRYLIISCS